MQGAQVLSLVGELGPTCHHKDGRSRVLQRRPGAAKINIIFFFFKRGDDTEIHKKRKPMTEAETGIRQLQAKE